MSEERTPPHVPGPAGRLAEALRSRQTGLDEFSQARMERELVQAWRTRPARTLAVGRAQRRRSVWAQAVFPISLSVAALVGAMFALRTNAPPANLPEGVAQFEMRLPDGGIQRGAVAEGQTLRSGRHSHLDVAIGRSRIEADTSTSMRFDRIDPQVIEFSVEAGHVEVSFHPRIKGQQRMAVNTRAARVLVVGTRFTVDVDGPGNTRVRVSEGVVEVVPRHGGSSHMVSAGQDLEVMVDPGDASERAVRDALAAQLAKANAVLPGAEEAPGGQAGEHQVAAGAEVPEADGSEGPRQGQANVEDGAGAARPGPGHKARATRAKPARQGAASARQAGAGEQGDPHSTRATEGARASGSRSAEPANKASGTPQGRGDMRKPRSESSSTSPGRRAVASLHQTREWLRSGQHARARAALLRLVRERQVAAHHRAEAWTLLAESHTAQGHIPKARHAYRMAARVAPGHPVGHNALFALARLLERYTRDADAARLAYGRYLERVPQGPLASQARAALCRLGEDAACRD